MCLSEVVIKSTENGPNLVIVNGKVVQAWCRCGGSEPIRLSLRELVVRSLERVSGEGDPEERPNCPLTT